jgi:hypothetical protein
MNQLQPRQQACAAALATFLLLLLAAALPAAPPPLHAQPSAGEPAGPPAELGVVLRNANVRAGPGTNYAVVGSAPAGTTVRIAGANKAGDWYHLTNGRWIAAFLVDLNGAGLSTAPLPMVAPTPAPAHVAPAPAPATPRAGGDGNRFVLIERRLWDVYENGGWLDGESVHCGDGRELVVNVLDANGSRLNGVAVQVAYGAREIEVTGAQGKGDGVAEFVLGGGQDVRVIRDTDGAPATSDVATGLSTNPNGINHSDLIAARYCQDDESCRRFVAAYGCGGHFSWTVTFQRR